MVYVKGILETCAHLQSIRTKAAKDKMPKMKRIIDLWNARCKEISAWAEDQLRSMGDESEWQKFYEMEDNPFKVRTISRPLFLEEEKPRQSLDSTTERSTTEKPEPQPTTTSKMKENAVQQAAAPRERSDQPILIKPLYRIGLSDAHPRLEYQSRTQQWTEPAYFSPQYKAAMNLHKVPGEICTILDVFSVPPGTMTEADLDCNDIFLAELSPGSPYFNPVFMQPADLAESDRWIC